MTSFNRQFFPAYCTLFRVVRLTSHNALKFLVDAGRVLQLVRVSYFFVGDIPGLKPQAYFSANPSHRSLCSLLEFTTPWLLPAFGSCFFPSGLIAWIPQTVYISVCYFLVFLFYTYQLLVPTHVGFRAHVKLASRMTTARWRYQTSATFCSSCCLYSIHPECYCSAEQSHLLQCLPIRATVGVATRQQGLPKFWPQFYVVE